MIDFKPISKNPSKNNEAENLQLSNDETFFTIQTANECIEEAKLLVRPKKLFAEFWHEGELSILFADTNVGKSILAVQIADSISKGKNIPGFALEAEQQQVILFDFELSNKQFEKRYSNDFTDHYIFHQNLSRAGINPNYLNFDEFEKKLFLELENVVNEKGAKVLIIDNITYLKTQSTETAKEALPLMKTLKHLKTKFDLSILALAHTPKRNLCNPITINDLAGSKHLANFVDSVFAIGLSQKDRSIRYLKQIKARATEKIYDHDNVIICEINNPKNFLGFNFLDFGNELEHLKTPNPKQTEELDTAIIAMKAGDPNLSLRDIASSLGTNPMKVKRALERNV
jgi:RecA-family ATPase